MDSTTSEVAITKPAQKNAKFVRILLYCGIASSIIYLLTDVIANFIWHGYSFVDQTVSELFAIGAPSTSVVVPFFIVYGLLIYLFGAGIWLTAGNKRALRVVAVLIIGKEVLGLFGTLFAPIHLRGVEATFSDTMHAIITASGVFLFMFPAMIYGSMAFGKKFRIYSIVTMVLFIVFGSLAGMQGQALAQNLPTPFMGIWERINIYGYMIWIIVLSLLLLRSQKQSSDKK